MTASIKNKVCVCLCEAEWLCDLFSYLPSKCGSTTVQALNSGSHKHYSFPRKKQLKQQCRKRHSNRVMVRFSAPVGILRGLCFEYRCTALSVPGYFKWILLQCWHTCTLAISPKSTFSLFFLFMTFVEHSEALFEASSYTFSTEILFSAKPVFPSLWILLFSPPLWPNTESIYLANLKGTTPWDFLVIHPGLVEQGSPPAECPLLDSQCCVHL